MQIFIDLDGTLIDASRRQYQLYCDYAHKHGYPTETSREYFRQKRRGIHIVTSGESRWRSIHIEDDNYLALDRLYSGVKKLLIKLQENELYIVTNRQRAKALTSELKTLEIHDYFKEIIAVHGSDPVYQKTKAVGERLSGKAIIIGDTEIEFEVSRNLGISFIGVCWGMRSREHLSRLGAKILVDHVSQMYQYLP